MLDHDRPTLALEDMRSSEVLSRLLASICDVASVVFDANGKGLKATTFQNENDSGDVAPVLPGKLADRAIQVSKIASFDLSVSELADLNCLCRGKPRAESIWCAFELRLENGEQDQIALKTALAEDSDLLRFYLKRIWSVLRQDCLRELQGESVAATDLDDSWDLLNRIDVAVLILDANCGVVRQNAAARDLLDASTFLGLGQGSIHAAQTSECAALRTAVAEAARGAPDDDVIVFLTSRDSSTRVPVTLSRYMCKGAPTDYVVAMLPRPPSPSRVEKLVREMGLTSSEARVAALMQLGLSNREAAEVSGLKPQTLNTYAKRVLNKLNVSGRTEMAQLLTWQASGGRSA